MPDPTPRRLTVTPNYNNLPPAWPQTIREGRQALLRNPCQESFRALAVVESALERSLDYWRRMGGAPDLTSDIAGLNWDTSSVPLRNN